MVSMSVGPSAAGTPRRRLVNRTQISVDLRPDVRDKLTLMVQSV